MDIELNLLNKEIILVLLICKDLNLDFREIKKLYLGNDKVFFKYLYHFFSAIKMTEDRLTKLSKLAYLINAKIINDSVVISNRDKQYYEYVVRRVKNRYECDGKLYDFKDFKDYLSIGSEKVKLNILLYNGDCLSNISEYDLNYHKDKIYKVILNSYCNGKEDSAIFTNISEYSFITKGKEESLNIKINPILKRTNIIDINKKEDLINLVKEDNVFINKDININCDIELDINIKCKNIYSEYSLAIGNLDALNVEVKNLVVNKIRATNLKVENITARNIEILNSIKANKISYYAVCFACNNIECNSIKGERVNSKHFSLDGEVIVNG